MGQRNRLMDIEKARQQLADRLKENYSEYRAELLLKDRQELIDGADRIARTAEVFDYLTNHNHTEQELTYLLKFQNPLEVIADHWINCDFELDALGTVVADAVEKADDLTFYPLAADEPNHNPYGRQKFANVDLEKILPKIMAQKTAFYQTDLGYALKAMRRGIASDDPDKRNFVLIFRESGVECLKERELFIAGTQDYDTCQYYHSRTTEPVLVYSVELLGNGQKGLRGNLYQQDQHQLGAFAERASSPYAGVTITFSGGKEVCISKEAYNHQTLPGLKYRYGDILDIRREAEDESVIQGAIRREHDRRNQMPGGRIAVHLQKLEESRIQTEADRLVSALQGLTEPNAPDQIHFMAKISPYFLPLASQDDIHRLFEQVRIQLKQPMYLSQTDDGTEPCFFMRREECVPQQSAKPSIKKQLSEITPSGGKPATKSKNREER